MELIIEKWEMEKEHSNKVNVYFIHEGHRMEKCGEGLIEQAKRLGKDQQPKYVIVVQKTQMEDQESDLSEEKQMILNPNIHQNRNVLLETEILPSVQYRESKGKSSFQIHWS